MKLKRGQKQCPKCEGINAARQCACKHCGYEFRKRKNADLEVEDWSSLVRGDYIKVYQGSGSYYYNSDGERTYLADAGPYLVQGKDNKGLMCFGIGKRNYGFAYVYMGPEETSPVFGQIRRSPHKISLLKKIKRTDIGHFMSSR